MKIKSPLEKDVIQQYFGEASLSIKQKIPHLQKLLKTGLIPEELDDLFVPIYSRTSHIEDSFLMMRLREPYVSNFGFFLLNDKLLNVLANEFRENNIIEVGAGTGWLSHNLQKNGLQVTPVDSHIEDNHYGFRKIHTEIVQADAVQFILQNDYDTILMCWPDLGSDFAHKILDVMPKEKTLIYIGEQEGGCTANDDFFTLLNTKCSLIEGKTKRIQKHVKQWAGIHDQIEIYKT